ncbi:MAG TPA: hypothetical protein VF557_15215 [Jatrophihabitans sp.]|jgi:hypothetical protein|uniref:hypothetical protein n=1 Tax=Jatrophihabitans sp. TaxID=1932789 RepID=UPI002EFF4F6C
MSDGAAAWVGVVGVVAGVVLTELFNLVKGRADRKQANQKELRERTRPDYEALLSWMKSASYRADEIVFLRISGSGSELGPAGKNLETLDREFWESFRDIQIDIAVVRIGVKSVSEAYEAVRQAISDLAMPLILLRPIDTQTEAGDPYLSSVSSGIEKMRARMSHLETLILAGLNPN